MISVIIPVYNADSVLQRCMESVIKQTVFEDIEVILINDGSTDNSKEIIDGYADKYSNIRSVHIENGGVSNARNIGVDTASGEFIAFLDADDYIDETWLEKLLSEFEDGADIVAGGYIAEYPDGSGIERLPKCGYRMDRRECIRHFLSGIDITPNIWDKMFRKTVLENVRFTKEYKIAEDKLFVFEAVMHSEYTKVIPYAGYHYVLGDSSAMRKKFDESKLHPIAVIRTITETVRKEYPDLLELAECAKIDVACRLYGEIYHSRVQKEFPVEYRQLQRDIRKFSLMKEIRYSSKKHSAGLLAAKIHPWLYNFLKNDLKFQYKN